MVQAKSPIITGSLVLLQYKIARGGFAHTLTHSSETEYPIVARAAVPVNKCFLVLSFPQVPRLVHPEGCFDSLSLFGVQDHVHRMRCMQHLLYHKNPRDKKEAQKERCDIILLLHLTQVLPFLTCSFCMLNRVKLVWVIVYICIHCCTATVLQ